MTANVLPIVTSTLSGLPEETLEHILAFLPNGSLLQVLQTCQLLQKVGERVLYRTIQMKFYRTWGPNDTIISDNLDRIDRLVENFNQPQTHLPLYVRDLDLKAPVDPTDPVMDQFQDLVGLIPNLRSLKLSPVPPMLDFTKLYTLRRLHLTFFPGTITRADMGDEDADAQLTCATTVAFALRLGRLETLSVVKPTELEHQWRSDIWFPGERLPTTANLTTLRVFSADSSFVPALSIVLGCIVALERFTFELDWTAIDNFNPRELLSALSHQEGTLTELSIAYQGTERFDLNSTFGETLRGYQRLRRLAIPDSFLFPYPDDDSGKRWYHERLPANLEELQLQCPFSNHEAYGKERGARVKRLRRLAWGPVGEGLPRLRRVVWWDQADGFGVAMLRRPGFEQQLKRLRRFWRKEIGVELELAKETEWKNTPFGEAEMNELD
ncbi:MAG: hypothetical protein LQ350_004526 [Teloschistes chrysophthalmus]|nr:MAG: hypothetical protein LQ350_004526 [Niorma chrysophthalma]